MMIKNQALFNQLIAQAEQQDFSGWDFSYLSNRWQTQPLSWDYRERVQTRMAGIDAMLDIDTGGGEFLAALAPLPADTCATEEYPPNIPLARKTLEPWGVHVAQTQDDKLPFEDERFDLVINRHGTLMPTELSRVLKSGGLFITQQVGGLDNFALNELLQDKPHYQFSHHTPALFKPQLEAAGFQITELQEDFPETTITDIGAVVYYLKAIPWQIEDFSVEKYYNRLGALHNQIQEQGGLTIKSHRFFIEARKQ